ncbi:hypothetical protein [Agrococcus beijingensis]|uniref:hypothetical protein n=1 Tax=Agrococcus beijingensis TaxID=3068634 RepID=UPI002740BA57|nr:hypothetical protein [Agrococcus sp. REN33]
MTAQPSAFGAREPVDIRTAAAARRQTQGLLQQIRQREQQQSQGPSPERPHGPSQEQPHASVPTVQASTPQPGPAPRVPVNPLAGRTSSPQAWPERPGGPTGPRRILGIQPVLFVGICLLAIVTIITVVLIFIGDFESQASRVVWTVVVFLAFTGLLAVDLVLARRSATPLVIGVAANIYLLAVLMISIWMRGSGAADDDPFANDWIFGELLGIVLLTVLVVRAAAAAAWGLIELGDRGRAAMARTIGLIASALVGIVGVLLTLHFAIDAFGLEVSEWYWRSTVAAIVVTALASSVTVLLYWNRRNIDWQEAEARGEHVRPAGSSAARIAAPGSPSGWPAWPAAGQAQQAPAPAPAPAPVQAQAPAPAPSAMQAPWQQPQPPQPDAQGLLPWPTHPDGTPYPMGPDGQPVFPR